MAKKAPNKSRQADAASSPATNPTNGRKMRPGVKSKSKKVVKVDKKMPKKPPTAFFYFLDDFRKGFQEQNPTVKGSSQISKACGEKWKTMKYEEKVQYYDIATEKRAEFDRAIAAYNKKKETGEDQDSEDSEYE